MLQRVFQIVAGVDARNGLARRPELTNRKRNPRGKAGLAPQTPPPEQGKPLRHKDRSEGNQTSCVDWSFSVLLAVTPHTSPQFSAPFPNDVVVVVDDKNSVEQVRQSDALEEGGVAERDSFKHILKFFLHTCTVCIRDVGVCIPFTWVTNRQTLGGAPPPS